MELFAEYPSSISKIRNPYATKYLPEVIQKLKLYHITIYNSIELYLSWEVMSNETYRAVPPPCVFFLNADGASENISNFCNC
jgi:hypothetical protein